MLPAKGSGDEQYIAISDDIKKTPDRHKDKFRSYCIKA
ncbi:hypothetical protein PPE_05585 [Paenibacillus polymyxa E681]|nr:hypothetical protein PPE_05585 [Paenibacillus polymyxa E681]